MKRIVTLFVCLFCSSLTWGQYVVNYQSGLMDLTTQATSGTNVWHQLQSVGTCFQGGLGIGYDGYVICANSTGTYHYNAANHSWDATGMTNAVKAIAVEDQDDVFSLQTTSYCTGLHAGSMSPFKWTGSAWSQLSACFYNLAVGSDGLLMGVSFDNNAYKSSDGITWSPMSPGGGWTYVSLSDATDMCGVKSGALYTKYASQPSFVAFSPSPGTVTGCVVNSSDPLLMVWTSTGVVKMYNYDNDTWGTVAGLSALQLASETKAKTLALDSAGHVFHFNVYGEYMSSTITGSFNGCPTQNIACNPGTTHTGTSKITLPGGIFGAQSTQTVSPTTNMNVSSFDASAACDFMFNDACDPVTVIETVQCNQAQHAIAVGGGGGAPPPPQKPHYLLSEDYVRWDTSRLLMQSIPWKGTGWQSTWKCGTNGPSACMPGTIPYCHVEDVNFTEKRKPGTKDEVDSIALAQCGTGPFAVMSIYFPGHPNSCSLVTVDKRAKVGLPCF